MHNVQDPRRCYKMEIDGVRTTGAALASVLQSMARNYLDFDGLILGKNQTTPVVPHNSYTTARLT